MTKLTHPAFLFTFLASVGVSHAALTATGVSSTNANDATIIAAADNADLGAAATVTGPNGFFGDATLLNNGVINPGNSGLYLSNSFSGNNNLPSTYTFALDVGSNALGYDITSIESFAGWTQNGPQLGNQRYTLSYSTVANSADFSNILGTFEYIPFNNNTAGGGAITHMTLADGGAVFATGVHSVRIEFLDHGFSGPTTAVDGSVYYEVDINGVATAVPEPSSSALLGLGAIALIMRRRK